MQDPETEGLVYVRGWEWILRKTMEWWVFMQLGEYQIGVLAIWFKNLGFKNV